MQDHAPRSRPMGYHSLRRPSPPPKQVAPLHACSHFVEHGEPNRGRVVLCMTPQPIGAAWQRRASTPGHCRAATPAVHAVRLHLRGWAHQNDLETTPEPLKHTVHGVCGFSQCVTTSWPTTRRFMAKWRSQGPTRPLGSCQSGGRRWPPRAIVPRLPCSDHATCSVMCAGRARGGLHLVPLISVT